jgi:hypothetical protein
MNFDPNLLNDFAQRYTEAWCSQDPARVAEFFSPNGSLKVNDAAPAIGSAAISEIAREFMTAFPDLHLVMDRLVIAGESAEYHWTLTGTNTGPGGSGRCVRISGFEHWQFSPEGLIAVSLGHFDTGEYTRQLEH